MISHFPINPTPTNVSRNLFRIIIKSSMNLIVVHIIILALLPIIPVTSQYASNDELDQYSDRDYYQMVSEYEDNLRASFAARQAKEEREAEMKRRIAEFEQSQNASADGQANVKKTSEVVESYAEMASRLKCDNPWFWNAPRCTWIDVKSNHVIARTKRNAEASAWFIGICGGLPLTWLCACYCFYLIKMKNRRKMALIREQNVPGRFQLPNGKVVEYQPTDEENKAYEELVKAIIIQEMSMMV